MNNFKFSGHHGYDPYDVEEMRTIMYARGPGTITYTVKPLHLEHVDNWFLKLVLYYLNKYIFKNHLSTCSR